MGKQKWIDSEPIQDATNHIGHVKKAVELESPLGRDFLLPDELEIPNTSICAPSVESISAFWGKQLRRIGNLIGSAAPSLQAWGTQQLPPLKGQHGG